MIFYPVFSLASLMEKILQVLRVHKINRTGIFANYVANFSVIFFSFLLDILVTFLFPLDAMKEKREVLREYTQTLIKATK